MRQFLLILTCGFTSQVALSSSLATDAGEIAAGIVEGFIGADDVKACIQKTVTSVDNLEDAVKDFEKKTAKDVLNGLNFLASAFEALSADLKACKAVESDIAQFVSAFKAMASPTSFAFHVGKDLIVNGADIYHEIYASVSDFKAQNWADFGVEIGTALHKLIIGASQTLQLSVGSAPAKEAGEIAAGLIEGFIGADDMKACIQNTVTTVDDLEDAVKDFEKKTPKDVLHGLTLLASAFEGLPADLKACKAVESDIAQFVSAFKSMASPTSFAFHVGKDLIVNGADIYHEIYASVGDFKTQKWADFGVEIGTALHKLIIGASQTSQLSVRSFPAEEAGEVAAGIVEGFIGADDVKACIQRTVTTVDDLEDAIRYFENKTAKDVLRGLKLLANAFEGLPADLKACKAVESDIAEFVKAFKSMATPTTFAFHVGKDLIVNGADIYHEIYASVNDFRAKKWASFGLDIGTALHKLLVGAISQVLV